MDIRAHTVLLFFQQHEPQAGEAVMRIFDLINIASRSHDYILCLCIYCECATVILLYVCHGRVVGVCTHSYTHVCLSVSVCVREWVIVHDVCAYAHIYILLRPNHCCIPVRTVRVVDVWEALYAAICSELAQALLRLGTTRDPTACPRGN